MLTQQMQPTVIRRHNTSRTQNLSEPFVLCTQHQCRNIFIVIIVNNNNNNNNSSDTTTPKRKEEEEEEEEEEEKRRTTHFETGATSPTHPQLPPPGGNFRYTSLEGSRIHPYNKH